MINKAISKRAGLTLFLAVFLFSSVLSLIPAPKAHAELSGTFIDRANIRVGNEIYTDKYPFEDDNNYKHWYAENCNSDFTISDGEFNDQSKTTFTVDIRLRSFNSTTNFCSEVKADKITISAADVGTRFVTAYKIDADNIFVPAYPCPPGSANTFENTVNSLYSVNIVGSLFGITNDSGLSDCINGQFRHLPRGPGFTEDKYPHYVNGQWDKDGDQSGVNVYYSGGTQGRIRTKYCTRGCAADLEKDLTFANGGKNATPDASLYGPVNADGSVGSSATAAADPTSEDNSCESQGAMAWILCPVIEIISSALEWIDNEIQALLIVDRNKYTDEDLRLVWANIRNIASIILVIMMLVMVIASAIGASFVDAYTVKKALPRMVAAVIFMALSWYICIFLIDFFNALGSGTLGIMTAPFRNAGGPAQPGLDGTLTLSQLFEPSAGGAVLQIGFIGLGAAALAIPGLGLLGILGTFIGTALLIMAIAFLVLMVRQIFIVALIVFAPIAILAWVFPGNDKLWKYWWETFTKLLFMFPIVMALIASGRIFAFVIGNTDSSGLEGGLLNPILKLLAYVLPYAFIPFAFKAAGGLFGNLVGMANDRSKGLFDRMKKGRQQRYERAGRHVLQKRADLSNRWQTGASDTNKSWARRAALRTASRRIGGYNIMAADSARRAAVSKELNDQIATGRDEEIRGLTVDKSTSASRIAADGTKQYQTLGGAWVSEAAVDDGHRRWGRDTYAQQAALSYEMRKASTNAELQNISNNYRRVAKNAWKMTDNEAGGAWIGAAFENQNQHLEYKYTNWENGDMSPDKARGFATEIYEKRGSYPLAQMGANTFAQLRQAYTQAEAIGDQATMNMIKGTAETFVQRGLVGGNQIGGGGDEAPVITPVAVGGGPTGAQQTAQTYGSGAGHVNEEIRRLANLTGVYDGSGPSPWPQK